MAWTKHFIHLCHYFCLLCSCDGPFSGTYKSVVDDYYTTMSALGNKGEKNQSKFKAIDINNLFKGSSVTPQKTVPGEDSAKNTLVCVIDI